MTPDDRLPEDLAAMLAVERTIPPPPPDAIVRVHARLRASVSAGATGAGWISIVASKSLVVLGVVAVLAGAVVLARFATSGGQPAPSQAPAIATPPATRPLPPAPVPSLPAGMSDPSTPSAPRDDRRAAAPPASRAKEPVPAKTPPRPSASERELLERAVGCLARHESGCALTAVNEHATRYADGKLAEEREALWIEALVLAGDIAGAQARTRAFLEAYPDSLYTAAVRRTLTPP